MINKADMIGFAKRHRSTIQNYSVLTVGLLIGFAFLCSEFGIHKGNTLVGMLAGCVVLALLLLAPGLLLLLVITAKKFGRRFLAIRIFLFVFLLVGFLPLPALSFRYASLDPFPHWDTRMPLFGFFEFLGGYFEYMTWAKTRALKCLAFIVAEHVGLTLFLGSATFLVWKRILRSTDSAQSPAQKRPVSIGDLWVAFGIGMVAMAVIIPNFGVARSISTQNMCINNLRAIDAAKEQAALAYRWSDAGAVVTTTVNSISRAIQRLSALAAACTHTAP